jgi:hypothetical protein
MFVPVVSRLCLFGTAEIATVDESDQNPRVDTLRGRNRMFACAAPEGGTFHFGTFASTK